MDPWTFLLCTFGVWRLSRMIVKEDGPFYIFQRFRIFMGIVDEEDEPPYSTTWYGTFFTCPLCVSVWISVPFTIVYQGGFLEFIAMTGLASILMKWTER